MIDTTDVRNDRIGHADFIETVQGAADLCRILLGKPAAGREDTGYSGVSRLLNMPPTGDCASNAASAIETLSRLDGK